MSVSKQSEVMRLDIADVTSPLPEQVKLRWGPYKQRQLAKPEGSLEHIQARMAAADQKRQVPTQALRNWQDRKLASASPARVAAAAQVSAVLLLVTGVTCD